MSTPTAAQVVDGVDLTGKTCVITGASSGLGRESARALASTGAHVILTARNPEALQQTSQAINADVRGARISTVRIDLTSLSGIAAAAEEIRAAAPVINILLNNAGVMFTPFGRTDDGFEMQFGTNHLGHFALTQRLLPSLSDDARIINVSSEGHRLSDIDLDDPNWQHREYDKFVAYGAAKTANILHAVELDRRLRNNGIRAYAVHPGMVATNLMRHMSRDDVKTMTSRPREQAIEVLTPEEGAATQVWAAVSPQLANTGGVYLADCAVRTDPAPYAVDPARAESLWALSESLTD